MFSENNTTTITTNETDIETTAIETNLETTDTTESEKKETVPNKTGSSLNMNDIDTIMEREKLKNKNDIWSKIDKTLKIQKLHAFAEKYGKEHNHSLKEIKTLKLYFINALEHGKLQKTKDVNYNKDNREIIGIPALYFDTNNRNFTLKNLDIKRVSTLKSLTPKRTTIEPKDKDNIITI